MLVWLICLVVMIEKAPNTLIFPFFSVVSFVSVVVSFFCCNKVKYEF